MVRSRGEPAERATAELPVSVTISDQPLVAPDVNRLILPAVGIDPRPSSSRRSLPSTDTRWSVASSSQLQRPDLAPAVPGKISSIGGPSAPGQWPGRTRRQQFGATPRRNRRTASQGEPDGIEQGASFQRLKPVPQRPNSAYVYRPQPNCFGYHQA